VAERAQDVAFPAAFSEPPDQTGLGDIEQRVLAPYHVMRLLTGGSGRQIAPDQALIASCGKVFTLPLGEYLRISRVADVVHSRMDTVWGCRPSPYGREEWIDTFRFAKSLLLTEYMLDPAKLRIMFLRGSDGGVTMYRCDQPVAAMQHVDAPFHVVKTEGLRYDIAAQYDLIVASRMQDRAVLLQLASLQAAGVMVAYEADDLLKELPEWNPLHGKEPPEFQARRGWLADKADATIFSTEELAAAMSLDGKTWVCHNGIPDAAWPCEPHVQQYGPPVRILWAGGVTHQKDIEVLPYAIEELIKKKLPVKWVFVGDVPLGLTEWVSRVNGPPERCFRKGLEQWCEHHPGCPTENWPRHLAHKDCDMAVAPLAPHPFNEAKSEIKALEAWALGIPVLAADAAPYRRAFAGRRDLGPLLPHITPVWQKAIAELAGSAELRTKRARAGLEELRKRYLLSVQWKEWGRAFAEIALKGEKLKRNECRAALNDWLTKEGYK
jgi:hypothetical protein